VTAILEFFAFLSLSIIEEIFLFILLISLPKSFPKNLSFSFFRLPLTFFEISKFFENYTNHKEILLNNIYIITFLSFGRWRKDLDLLMNICLNNYFLFLIFDLNVHLSIIKL